ncbi:MAG TPA: UDP-N-acetylmuramate--L-alanine ligase [Thermomicrobiales bacterium]|nr:UDP-N-acetylmuramate--L-alanine ligase [Thermomicrobiales bacterium]
MPTFQSSTITELPPPPARIHFVGVGGVSMSGLARILRDWGYVVSGSDRQASPVTELLASLGIEVQIGHGDASLAGSADILVATPPALTGAPVEIEAAAANGVEILRRGQLLGLIANARQPAAVAGSHGKSTTSGMLTTALIAIGAHPSYSVGATVASTGRNADSGSGPHFVVEADEYDRALLWLKPEVAIITTVAFDHPDIFADQEDYDQVFVDFASEVRPGGTLVISADDEGCRRVLARIGEDGADEQIITFGIGDDADWRYQRSGGGWQIVTPGGDVFPITLRVPGAHNVANATAAVAAIVALGFPVKEAVRGVEAFAGVGRRFEHRGMVGGVDVVDDYAHHPDEIRATLAAARERYPGRRMVALFQPHTFSRTALLLDEFAESLDEADVPLLLEIYPAREVNTWGVTSASVAERMEHDTPVMATPDDAAGWLASHTHKGDVVLTLGAGDVTVVGAKLIEALRLRATRTSGRRSVGKPAAGIPLEGTDAIIQRNGDMAMFTTIRLGGSADFLIRAPTPDVTVAALVWAEREGLPVTVIGGGSNLLVSDHGVRGLVIVARTPGQRAGSLVEVEDGGDSVLVRVGGQAPMSWLGRHAAEQGWAGLDWAVGLPGQVGGATINNAGAHGTESKDHLVEIEVFEGGDLRRYDRDWLEPAPRMTRVKESPRPRPWTLLRSVFRLPKADPQTLVALAENHAAFRKRTQPSGACSGSIFVNPEGDFAGRLLEEAGIKGMQVGSMQFSDKHANWMINTGGGTAWEAWQLIRTAQGIIRQRYGIDLRPEIECVGDPFDGDEDERHMEQDQIDE